MLWPEATALRGQSRYGPRRWLWTSMTLKLKNGSAPKMVCPGTYLGWCMCQRNPTWIGWADATGATPQTDPANAISAPQIRTPIV
jgi:hypothetical protein